MVVFCCSCFSRSLGPRKTMEKAPRGAVMRMERTARVRISRPIGSHSGLLNFLALSRKTGPMAACTAAFGNQANAMNSFSLVLRVPPDTAITTPSMRKMRAVRRTRMARPADSGSILSTCTSEPIRANRMGSRMIHILPKALLTGLWSVQPSLRHCTMATKARMMAARLPAPS